MRNDMIVLFDVDDVIVDWRGSALNLIGPDAEEICNAFHRREEPAKEVDLWALIKAQPKFWLDLPKTPWADELIASVELLGIDWFFCTAQSDNDSRSATQKIEWAKSCGWNSHDKMVITKQKWLLAGPNKVLIDDKDSNIEEFREHGGYGILMPQTWNDARAFVGGRLRYVLGRLQEIISK